MYHVCMCACMYVSTYICMHVCMYVCMCVCMYVTYVCMQDTYEEQPKEQSNIQLSQTRKWFKHVPEKFMAPPPQIWGKGGPLDPYEVFKLTCSSFIL